MKNKIVIIGANDFQNQLILKAQNMGYETHVFAWKCGDIGEQTADFFYPISIVEKNRILKICREIKPQGVISIASDLASITVNYLAEQLGLIGNGMASAVLSTNKHQMRHAFEKKGVPSPRSKLVPPTETPDISDLNFPLIVKPTDRSGSRGISKIETKDQLMDAVQHARNESFEKEVLVEEFAVGDEFSVEYISYQAKHHFLALTKKYTTESPNFIETGHMEPAPASENVVRSVQSLAPKALDALGIRYGASHVEVKLDNEGHVMFIEIGGRMGGDCIGSDLVFLSTGYDYLEMVIHIACGSEPRFEVKRNPGYAMVQFIFNNQDIDNLEWLKLHYPEAIYRIGNIQPPDSRAIEDSSSRYGYYIASTNNKVIFDDIMRKING